MDWLSKLLGLNEKKNGNGKRPQGLRGRMREIVDRRAQNRQEEREGPAAPKLIRAKDLKAETKNFYANIARE